MKAIIQRVDSACVQVDGEIISRIEKGLLVYLGCGGDDTEKDVKFMARKIAELRIFADEAGKMNRSVMDVGGQVLVVSNFTLYGDCRKGRRPGFDQAAAPDKANELYEMVVAEIGKYDLDVRSGTFQAHMHVESTNNGPVNFIVTSNSPL